MKLKYKVKDEVETIFGVKGYVNCVQIYEHHVEYEIWNGTAYSSFEEWQLKKIKSNKYAGFTIN